jgi:putative Mg2+ transporter-C (MgtC) family protein
MEVLAPYFRLEELYYLIRIALAALLAGVIGLERERAAQDAGLRTIMLVGTGSSIFTVLSIFAFPPGPTGVNDPARVAAQVVVGIGFLGAGALIRRGEKVKNLTTAATIWVAAAIGMATGVGWFVFAIGATLITFAILAFLRWVEHQLPFSPKGENGASDAKPPTDDTLHPQPNLGTSPRMGWLEDAPEKNYEAD